MATICARPDAGRRAPAARALFFSALALAGASCQGRCGAHDGSGGGASPSASPSGSAGLPEVCEQRLPNSVSDDDAPVARGVGESTPMLAWFEARGVAKGKVLDWLVAHQAGDRAWVGGQTAEQACQTLRVGAPSGEAIFCEYVVRSDTMLAHGVAFVARGGRPVAVLDVGLGARAMDWPDVRNLDLAIAFAPDGLSAQIAERAPEGTKLVEPRARCAARERWFDECEAKLAAAAPTPDARRRDPAADPALSAALESCPVERGPDGALRVTRDKKKTSLFSDGAYPAELHGCASARKLMRQTLAGVSLPDLRADAQRAITFIDKSCAELGRWAWRGGRFVREAK